MDRQAIIRVDQVHPHGSPLPPIRKGFAWINTFGVYPASAMGRMVELSRSQQTVDSGRGYVEHTVSLERLVVDVFRYLD